MLKLFRPPRRVKWIFPSLTWRLAVSEQIVFLTFDDGPHPDITPFVLDELKKHDMKATFFCVGENLVRYPEIKERIVNEGHSIGNHTMRHTNGSKVSNDDYFASVNDFEEVFSTRLFRPPYGRLRRSQINELKKDHTIIMWSLLTYDFDKSVPVSKILRETAKMRPGDIIVLHDNPKIQERCRELLPRILQQLRNAGMTSAAITEEILR